MIFQKNKYEKLYKEEVKEYRQITNKADIYKLLPAQDKKLREDQLRLTDFCHELLSSLEKEGINYFLCYGNLIGAIRHQGFIPWDDDFDVEMFREDYNKLIKYCESNFIKIDIKDSLGNVKLRYDIIEKYLKRYPDKILYFMNPYYLKLIKGASLNDILVLDCFVLDFYKKEYDIKEHLAKLTSHKDKINALKTDKERLEYLHKERELNSNILKNRINGCQVYHGLDSLSSYDKWRSKYFFDLDDYLPAKKVSFEGKEFWAPNRPEKLLNLTYGDICSFPKDIDLSFHEDFRTRNANKNILRIYLRNLIFNNPEKKLILSMMKHKLRNKTKYYKKKYLQKKKEVEFLKQLIK